MKILNGVQFVEDNGDILLICGNKSYKLTDSPKVTGIAVTMPPTKTAYAVGEEFEPAGMVITATYDNGAAAAIAVYEYAPVGELTAEDTAVTISYAGKTATQAITVA